MLIDVKCSLLLSCKFSDNLLKMKSRKKFFPYLLIALLDAIALFLFIYTFDPYKLLDAFIVKLSPIPIVIFLIFVFISCLFTFILLSKRRGIFIGLFTIAILLLQYFKAANPIFIIIVILIFILLELLFIKKRE